jgi:hypothetical protein
VATARLAAPGQVSPAFVRIQRLAVRFRLDTLVTQSAQLPRGSALGSPAYRTRKRGFLVPCEARGSENSPPAAVQAQRETRRGGCHTAGEHERASWGFLAPPHSITSLEHGRRVMAGAAGASSGARTGCPRLPGCLGLLRPLLPLKPKLLRLVLSGALVCLGHKAASR